MESIYWLLLFIVLLVIEILTMGLTTIWFAGGALVSFVACLFGAGLEAQVYFPLGTGLETWRCTGALSHFFTDPRSTRTGEKAIFFW